MGKLERPQHNKSCNPPLTFHGLSLDKIDKVVRYFNIKRISTVRFYFDGRKTKNEKTFKLNFYLVIKKKTVSHKPVTEKLKAG